MQSPPWPSLSACQKWLKPAPNRLASDAKEPMCPPRSPPSIRVVAVRLDHHRHRVPAHVGAQPLFDLEVAGAALFLVRFDRVHIAGIGRERHVDAALAGMLQQLLEQVVGALRALGLMTALSASIHSRVSWASGSGGREPIGLTGTADMRVSLVLMAGGYCRQFSTWNPEISNSVLCHFVI
jgi:hypothetical protein